MDRPRDDRDVAQDMARELADLAAQLALRSLVGWRVAPTSANYRRADKERKQSEGYNEASHE